MGTDVKTPLVAWKHVCKPKSIGGLGVRPAGHFNNSALAKLSWKILIDHNNWWVQIVRRKYSRKSNSLKFVKNNIPLLLGVEFLIPEICYTMACAGLLEMERI